MKEEKINEVVCDSTFLLVDSIGDNFCSYHGYYNTNDIYEQLTEILKEEIDKDILKKYLIYQGEIEECNDIDNWYNRRLDDYFIKRNSEFNIVQENDILSSLNNIIFETGIFDSIEFTSIYQPREYNFRSDSFDFKLSLKNELSIEELQTVLVDYFQQFKNDKRINELLRDKFESRSGFISFYSEMANINSFMNHISDIEYFYENLTEIVAIYFSVFNLDDLICFGENTIEHYWNYYEYFNEEYFKYYEYQQTQLELINFVDKNQTILIF